MDVTKYTGGDWKVSSDGKKVVAILDKNNDNAFNTVCHINLNVEERESNAELLAEAKNLIQIAEMFYDHMKSTRSFNKNSIPFTITETVLKRLKTR